MLNELWPGSIEAQINNNALPRIRKKGKQPCDQASPMLQVQYAAIIAVFLRMGWRRRWVEGVYVIGLSRIGLACSQRFVIMRQAFGT